MPETFYMGKCFFFKYPINILFFYTQYIFFNIYLFSFWHAFLLIHVISSYTNAKKQIVWLADFRRSNITTKKKNKILILLWGVDNSYFTHKHRRPRVKQARPVFANFLMLLRSVRQVRERGSETQRDRDGKWKGQGGHHNCRVCFSDTDRPGPWGLGQISDSTQTHTHIQTYTWTRHTNTHVFPQPTCFFYYYF